MSVGVMKDYKLKHIWVSVLLISYERLQTKTKEFTHLTYTGLVVELEHLKIETRLIDENFVITMGEYVT